MADKLYRSISFVLKSTLAKAIDNELIENRLSELGMQIFFPRTKTWIFLSFSDKKMHQFVFTDSICTLRSV